MEQTPKTIQVYLPHGEPRGIRLAEITSRTIRAIQIPRNRFKKASELEDLSEVGVYFLLGDSDASAKPEVYIGEAENTLERLQRHNRDKDFWNTAVAIVSRTDRFTKAHVRYLEWLCWKDARDVDRYKVKNDYAISEPSISRPMKAELQDNYETIRTLLSTLEFPLLEDPRDRDHEEVLICEGKNARGKGIHVEDGFLILSGSRARKDSTPSLEGKAQRTRQNLVETGIVTAADDQYVFEEDFMASSPSHAACVVLGSPANGWDKWKNSEGATLHEIEREVD